MKPIICKHCQAVNKHQSFQCYTKRKPIKVNIVTKEWKAKQADIKKSKGKIANVSEKQKERLKTYRKLRDAYMREHLVCEAKLGRCTMVATDLHHKKGRDNENLFSHFMALCRTCHMEIEEADSEWVYEQGFKIKRM